MPPNRHELERAAFNRLQKVPSVVPEPLPVPAIATRCLADVVAKPVSWLWPGKIARGKVTIIAGNPGLGKSQLCASIAAIVTRGLAWPVDRVECESGSVIFVNGEDDPSDTLKPRLEAAGALVHRVHIVDGVRAALKTDGTQTLSAFSLADHIAQLGELLERIGDVAVVFIDPITAFLGKSADSHKNSDVRALLAPLADLAARYNVAIIAISHLSKTTAQKAMMRVSGSLAFVAAARAAYLVTPDPENPARRLFLPMKNNIGPDGEGLAFTIQGATVDAETGSIETSRIMWENEAVRAKADDILDADRHSGGPTALTDAADWLQETLADGPVSATEVFKQAEAEGISAGTLRRAKKGLGIETTKGGMGEGWTWKLPKMLKSDEDAQQ